MEAVAEHGTSVVLSWYLVGDLERACDYLVVLAASRARVAGAAGLAPGCPGKVVPPLGESGDDHPEGGYLPVPGERGH